MEEEATEKENIISEAARNIDGIVTLDALEAFRENCVAKTGDSRLHISNLCSVSRMYRV
mgnify:CR=1 FL=1